MDPKTKLGRSLIRAITRIHLTVYQSTGGRVGHRLGPLGGGASTLLLEHVGAKSGTLRRSPLLYIEDGDDLAIVASYHGASNHPAWFHNLRAHPETTVRVGQEVRAVRARIAGDVERARLWPKAVKGYKPYDAFQRHAATAGRIIPIVILERRRG